MKGADKITLKATRSRSAADYEIATTYVESKGSVKARRRRARSRRAGLGASSAALPAAGRSAAIGAPPAPRLVIVASQGTEYLKLDAETAAVHAERRSRFSRSDSR
jgi:hypothetical protein